jgi:hypothetical protein
MADYAASKLGARYDEIAVLEVLPSTTGGSLIGGSRSLDTLVTLRDGSTHEVSMDCHGLPGLQCLDDPLLEATSVMTGGYFDVPCAGEPPDGCATPVPATAPDALAAAVPLSVPRLNLPIDRVGRHEVIVGEATLPNGILSVAEFAFVSNEWPSDFKIVDGIVRLEVRSLEHPDRPFWNVYEHGWVPGTERVEVLLLFDVLRHEPGATLSIRDLVVG